MRVSSTKKKRQTLTLVEDDLDDVLEADASSVTRQPDYSARDYTEFAVMEGWLRETLAKLLAVNLSTKKFQQISDDLVRLGDIAGANGFVPVYLARGLWEPKVIFRLEEELRIRENAGEGIVLCAGPEAPRFLANNVAVPFGDVWNGNADPPGLSPDLLLDRFNSERRLIAQNTMAKVVRSGKHSGNFVMNGKDSLPLSTRIQLDFFEKLAESYNAGTPEVHTGVLIEGTSARTPREIFTGKMRKRVFET